MGTTQYLAGALYHQGGGRAYPADVTADGFRGIRLADPGCQELRWREKRRSGNYLAAMGRSAPPVPKQVRLPRSR
jgi:hypothetical protein